MVEISMKMIRKPFMFFISHMKNMKRSCSDVFFSAWLVVWWRLMSLCVYMSMSVYIFQ
jgi:hypothetical protein